MNRPDSTRELMRLTAGSNTLYCLQQVDAGLVKVPGDDNGGS